MNNIFFISSFRFYLASDIASRVSVWFGFIFVLVLDCFPRTCLFISQEMPDAVSIIIKSINKPN